MAVNEQIVTGRKFRKLIDETSKLWQRISFWSKSSDVEFEDGKDAETKLGAINGITSDLSCEDSTIAASAAALNQVNRSLGTVSSNCDSINVYVGSDGKIHFKNSAGADTALNFNKTIVQNVTFKDYTFKKTGTVRSTVTIPFPSTSEMFGSGYTFAGVTVISCVVSYGGIYSINNTSVVVKTDSGNSEMSYSIELRIKGYKIG